MSDLATLESVSISTTTPVEEISRILNDLDVMKRRIHEAEAFIEQQLIERIKESGPFVVGSIRYYVGRKRTTKCVNVPAALDAVLMAVGGDWEKFATFLAAQPVKHGAARSLLPGEVFDGLFRVEEEDELKEGSAGKLMKVDQRFLK